MIKEQCPDRVIYPIFRYVQQHIFNRKFIRKIHIYALSVSPYPDNILKPVFHQAEDARLNINGLHSILHLRIRQIFQLNQSAAFKTNIIIVFLLNDR